MSCARSYNRSILSKLSWMSRQLRRYDDLQSIQLWANSMHLVKNLLITPTTPENSVHVPQNSTWNETISAVSSPSLLTSTPRNYSNSPPGFSPTDGIVYDHGSRKWKQSLKTGLHTTPVSHKNLGKERSEPQLNNCPLKSTFGPSNSSTTQPSLSVMHQLAINYAPVQSAMDKSKNDSLSHPPITTTCGRSISPALNLCYPPVGNVTRTPTVKKSQCLNKELIPQWTQCSKCKKWRVVMSKLGQTLKPSPSWTCAQNSSNSSYNSCKAPKEKPNIEDYSQTQLMALSRHRDLLYKKFSSKWKHLKLEAKPPATIM